MIEHADVIVVGGGIAGCAVAARLTDAGHEVTVLERELAYTDRVRGEGRVNWGSKPHPRWDSDPLSSTHPEPHRSPVC